MLAYVPLLLAMLGLLIGPAMYVVPHLRSWDRLLDSFTVAAVGGLCLFHLLPSAVDHGGWMAIVAAAAGLWFPFWMGRLRGIGPWALLVGLVIHASLESAAMAMGNHSFGIAVVLHRLPVGFAVFALFHEHAHSNARGWVAIGSLVLATLVGFLAGPPLVAATPLGVEAILEAGVAGMLLHVLWEHGQAGQAPHAHGTHEPHTHEAPTHEAHTHEAHTHQAHDHVDAHDHAHAHEHAHDAHAHAHETHAAHGHHEPDAHAHAHIHGSHGHDHHVRPPSSVDLWSAFAAVLGIAVVVGVVVKPGDHHTPAVLETALELALETAPALALAYLIAGLLYGALNPAAAAWLGTGGRFGQGFKGVAFGLPLPICSCGVLPLYQTLVLRGVPATAAMGFLIATPELGIDALLISLPLLGVQLTVARAVAALVVALAVAWIVGPQVPELVVAHEQPQDARPLAERLWAGLRFGLVDLVDHTLPWVLLGLLIAAFAQPLLSGSWMVALSPWLQVPLFALIGVPVYVCASGATPLAAVMIYQGISPGAALAFLLAGPATNLTTFGVLGNLHGTRVAWAFGAAVTVGAVLCGWFLDLLPITVAPDPTSHSHADPSLWQLGGLGFLTVLALASLVRQGPRGMVGQVTDPIHAHS